MAREQPAHAAIVDQWMATADHSTAAELMDLFEAGLLRVWQRAQPTLGEVTLGAILDRVLYTATERFSFLGPLELKDGRIDFDGIRQGSSTIVPGELASATRFVVLEFLTVLGHLTAEILTPALHAELVKVEPRRATRPARRRTKLTS